MTSQVSFGALPTNLCQKPLQSLTASDLRVIITDAADKAGVMLETEVTTKALKRHNKDIFTKNGVVSDYGADYLQKWYACINKAYGLRDALAKMMKKDSGNGNFNML